MFHESEPFYGERTELSGLFEALDHSLTGRNGQEGESYSQIEQQTTVTSGVTSGVQSQPLIVGTIPIPLREGNARIGPTNPSSRRIEGKELQVYSRRPRNEI
jgi:hypothetical protein